MPLLLSVIFTLAAISAAASATGLECNCPSGGGKFCGTDGECHNLSCANYYQYGNPNAASQGPNVDEVNTETLTCKDIETTATGLGSELFYGSVSYRCSKLLPPPIQTGFNRKCTADGPTFEFTCYELSEGTQFLNFLSEVDSAVNAGMDCTNDEDPGQDPFFSYAYVFDTRDGPSDSFTTIGNVFNETAELDKVRATTGTLYSLYWKNPPTPAPTPAPIPAPTSSSSHHSIAASKNWLTMSVAVWLPCSVLYSLLF